MRGAPTILWTCDKCRKTDTHLAEHGAPAGWRRVTSADIDSRATQRSGADWCGACVRRYLEPLATTEDDR